LGHKTQIVAEFLEQTQPSLVWDLGANTGRFSRVASQQGILTICFDADPAAVEINYRSAVKEKDSHLLPLWVDLTNPSASIGWHNRERSSLLERGPADAVIALALIHHLAISNNVPLRPLADFLAEAGRWLVVEFVPKQDLQVQKLLASREDIFSEYEQGLFEQIFSERFNLHQCVPVRDSQRTVYLMETKV
jgi:ribosomal protein L11 methylase PrmA